MADGGPLSVTALALGGDVTHCRRSGWIVQSRQFSCFSASPVSSRRRVLASAKPSRP